MTRQPARRRWSLVFWRIANPIMRPLAGLAPWWVLVEATGRRSGLTRRVPVARGPREHGGVWIVSVHGERAAFVQNIRADPRVRLRMTGRWRSGTATVAEIDPELAARLNAYIRFAIRTIGIEPCAVRIDFDD